MVFWARWGIAASAVIMVTLAAGCGGTAGAPSEPTAPAVPTAATSAPDAANPALQAAIADLAKARNVDPSRISVAAVQATEWRDASLGCPQPGRSYAQVITPGWRIQLRLDGQTMQYHTNQSGSVVTECTGP